MAECECLAGCIFFNDKMANKPATAQILKNQYCLGDSESCARHQIFKKCGKEKVPNDLFPNQNNRVDKIIHS